jgi:acetoin utilization deacetylase AcuC-like enzyme
MITIYSDEHILHSPEGELEDGKFVPPFEKPERARQIVEALKKQEIGGIYRPDEFSLEPVLRVHDRDYLDFLASVWDEFSAAGRTGEIVPFVWPVHGRDTRRIPRSLDGRLGYYSISADTSICSGTWKAVRASVNTALTGADKLSELSRKAKRGTAKRPAGVFSLCRPPGHHAGRNFYGGYCFLNNAAIAAQYLLDSGAHSGERKIAVLDVDFHHGNGTQSIFYKRQDVYYLSIHGDPADEFPYFCGYADELGTGEGEGYNHNYPLPPGSGSIEWLDAFNDACEKAAAYAPDYLVVSLGVDPYKNDPISSFALETEDFFTYGRHLGTLRIPTLFVMEGGYDINTIGKNVCSVLKGFEEA